MYKRLDFDSYKKYVSIEKKFEKNSNCEYILTIIKKHTDDGKRIFPRVRFTNKEFDKSTSLFDYMKDEEVLFAINSGIFNTKTNIPECVLVSKRKIMFDTNETYKHTSYLDGGEKRNELYILGIDINGDLKIYEPKYTASEIIEDGCIDAIMGFVPLIKDYKEFIQGDDICLYSSMDKHPRQVIGQYENGDFYILTINSPGMTFKEMRILLREMKVPFAYNLDGGSSTQTVFHKEQLNPIYKNDTGRIIPTIITFEIIDGNFDLT